MAHPQVRWSTPEAWASLTQLHRLPRRDRRREARYIFPRGVMVQLRIVPETETVCAELRNISRHGVALLTQTVAEPESYISFYFGGSRIYGQVRHCRFTRVGYIIGARVTDVFHDDGQVGSALNL